MNKYLTACEYGYHLFYHMEKEEDRVKISYFLQDLVIYLDGIADGADLPEIDIIVDPTNPTHEGYAQGWASAMETISLLTFRFMGYDKEPIVSYPVHIEP